MRRKELKNKKFCAHSYTQKDCVRKYRLIVRISKKELDFLDTIRGDTPRSTFVRFISIGDANSETDFEEENKTFSPLRSHFEMGGE